MNVQTRLGAHTSNGHFSQLMLTSGMLDGTKEKMENQWNKIWNSAKDKSLNVTISIRKCLLLAGQE